MKVFCVHSLILLVINTIHISGVKLRENLSTPPISTWKANREKFLESPYCWAEISLTVTVKLLTMGMIITVKSHGLHGISNPHELDRLFPPSKLWITDHLWWILLMTGGFPSQRASDMETLAKICNLHRPDQTWRGYPIKHDHGFVVIAFVLCEFVWFIYPYFSGMLFRHCDSHMCIYIICSPISFNIASMPLG